MSFTSSNASLLPPHLSSSNSSFFHALVICLNYRSDFFIFTAFSITYVFLLLPLCILILYLGLQRWRKQRSAPTATTSPTDIIVYHLVAMEMIGIFGCGFYICGVGVGEPWLLRLGMCFLFSSSNGEIFFHLLTCVEHHLAVVHPLTYLGLRKRGGVGIRSGTIGCIWLLYLGSFTLNVLTDTFSFISCFCFSVVSIPIISFCSVSVLRALIGPGPGDGGRDRERLRQSRMRAFYTIMIIMGALLLRFWGTLLAVVIYTSSPWSERWRCVALVSGDWFSLPSCVVLPLLYLHRTGNLLCCKNNT